MELLVRNIEFVLVVPRVKSIKEQFAGSPDLASELTSAIIDALAAYEAMSRQALDSEKVREGLLATLLGPARLYEALRKKGLAK